MCDVNMALKRATVKQLVFLLRDWDDYQYFIRIVAKI